MSEAEKSASSTRSTRSGLLLVASDRISVFRRRPADRDPGQRPSSDRVLRVLVRANEGHRSEPPADDPTVDGRSTECKRLVMLPIECVVRGYLAGSGWKTTGERRGLRHQAPPGLSDQKAPRADLHARRPRGRGDTRAAHGLSGGRVGDGGSPSSTALDRAIPNAAEYAATRESSSPTRSSSSARRDEQLILIDEAFTPDSCRFWPADKYEPGGQQPSFDKQFVRDYAETLGWDKTPRALCSPTRSSQARVRRHIEAFEQVTGIPFDEYAADPGRADEGDRARQAQAGNPRPGGQGSRKLPQAPRLYRRGREGRAARRSGGRRPRIPKRRGPRSSACAGSSSPTP